jgi:hypothetical protein
VPHRASDIESLVRESQTFAAVTGVGCNGAFDLTVAIESHTRAIEGIGPSASSVLRGIRRMLRSVRYASILGK